MALVVRRGCAPIMELVNVHLAGKVDMRALTYGALKPARDVLVCSLGTTFWAQAASRSSFKNKQQKLNISERAARVEFASSWLCLQETRCRNSR